MITAERLKQLLEFNNEEGRFYWRKRFGRGLPGWKNGQAGSFDGHGYGQIRIDGKVYKEHRLVWLYVHGEWPPKQIDHINHIRRDNRIENLRIVDNVGNHKNRPMQKNNTTGYVGVSVHKKSGRYRAYIHIDGVRVDLGYYDTIDAAASARFIAGQNAGFHINHGHGAGVPKKHKTTRKKSATHI